MQTSIQKRKKFEQLFDEALIGDEYSEDFGTRAALSPEVVAASKSRQEIKIEIEIPFGFTRTTGDPATTTGLTSIGKLPFVATLGVQPPRVADLMVNTPTDATYIRYIQENSLTNAAADVVENGQLPEETWDLSEVDSAIRRISTLARITRETFNDFAQLRDYLNNRILYKIGIKADIELLNGDATGARIRGLLNVPGIQNQAQGIDTTVDAIYKAVDLVHTNAFFEPDAIVMHPKDLRNLRLSKDRNGQYLFGGPFTGSYGQPGTGVFQLFVWGLPVVWTTSIAQGTCLVGAFKLGAQIFRKPSIGVEMTNSDGNDFTNDRFAIRANTRLTLACLRPLAFCTVTGLN
jgi:HK97 family phage major capsid protein